MCLLHPDTTCSDERFNFRRELEGVFFHKCFMRNTIYPAPCWGNKSISTMPPSNDGIYLTSMWMVLLSPALGRPYFTMGSVIT